MAAEIVKDVFDGNSTVFELQTRINTGPQGEDDPEFGQAVSALVDAISVGEVTIRINYLRYGNNLNDYQLPVDIPVSGIRNPLEANKLQENLRKGPQNEDDPEFEQAVSTLADAIKQKQVSVEVDLPLKGPGFRVGH